LQLHALLSLFTANKFFFFSSSSSHTYRKLGYRRQTARRICAKAVACQT